MFRIFRHEAGKSRSDQGTIHLPSDSVTTKVLDRKSLVEREGSDKSPAPESFPDQGQIYHLFNGVQDQFKAWWEMYNVPEADRLSTKVEITKGTKSVGMSFLEQKLQGLRDAFEACSLARPSEVTAALVQLKHELELVERQIKNAVDRYILESEEQLQTAEREYADVGGIIKNRSEIVTRLRGTLTDQQLEFLVGKLESMSKDLDIPKMRERTKVLTELRDSVNDLTQQIHAHLLGLEDTQEVHSLHDTIPN